MKWQRNPRITTSRGREVTTLNYVNSRGATHPHGLWLEAWAHPWRCPKQGERNRAVDQADEPASLRDTKEVEQWGGSPSGGPGPPSCLFSPVMHAMLFGQEIVLPLQSLVRLFTPTGIRPNILLLQQSVSAESELPCISMLANGSPPWKPIRHRKTVWD